MAQPERGTGVSVRREPSFPSLFTAPGFGPSPFGFIRRMMEDFERMMGEVSGSLVPGARQEEMLPLWSPQVEVLQRGNELVVRADLPGLREDDVRVSARDDVLVIEGERRSERETEERGFYRSEVRYGSFRRAIPLPEGADVDSANARFEDGVLEVSLKLPEQQRREARRIEVKAGEKKESKPGEQGKSIH